MSKRLMLRSIITLMAMSAISTPSHAAWYGLYTTESIPGCRIIDSMPAGQSGWYSNATGKDVNEQLVALQNLFIKSAKEAGWEAIVGYREFSFSGGGGLPVDPYYSGGNTYDARVAGAIDLRGVAVKVSCK